ncbi:hypothetical protein ACM66B_000310 [Microbotryomycetes sp. NB124-2]
MAPAASGSSKTASKLTADEQKLLKAGLAAPNGTIGQDDLVRASGYTGSPQALLGVINSLMRKNLAVIMTTSTGELEFRFVSKTEAKQMGSMDVEEKVVYDHIKEAGNSGIWTKTLASKTNLPRTVITKVLKTLENRKTIKPVKSVKTPTRKIYMLSNLTPSVELTGGPWFTDNELDTEFVATLKDICAKYIDKKSYPSKKDKKMAQPQFLPVAAVQHLPTVNDVCEFILSSGIAVGVDLKPEHVESLLELLVFDGLVERIFVNKERATSGQFGKAKKEKRQASDSESEEDERAPMRGKKRKAGTTKSTNGKRATKKQKTSSSKSKSRLRDDSDDEQSSESDQSFDSDEEAPTKSKVKDEEDDDDDVDSPKKRTKKRRKDRTKKARVKNESDESQADSEVDDSDDNVPKRKPKIKTEADSAHYSSDAPFYQVYRSLRPYKPLIGWLDMPCGHCPSESFCWEPLHAKLGNSTVGSTAHPSGLKALPKVGIGIDDGMQGVGMLGGVGAAIGVSNEKWGQPKGGHSRSVAPVNPIDCRYFKEWLEF